MAAESCDPVTELIITDMLCFCLEHADKNLPRKSWITKKVCLFFLYLPARDLVIFVVFGFFSYLIFKVAVYIMWHEFLMLLHLGKLLITSSLTISALRFSGLLALNLLSSWEV